MRGKKKLVEVEIILLGCMIVVPHQLVHYILTTGAGYFLLSISSEWATSHTELFSQLFPPQLSEFTLAPSLPTQPSSLSVSGKSVLCSFSLFRILFFVFVCQGGKGKALVGILLSPAIH